MCWLASGVGVRVVGVQLRGLPRRRAVLGTVSDHLLLRADRAVDLERNFVAIRTTQLFIPSSFYPIPTNSSACDPLLPTRECFFEKTPT